MSFKKIVLFYKKVYSTLLILSFIKKCSRRKSNSLPLAFISLLLPYWYCETLIGSAKP